MLSWADCYQKLPSQLQLAPQQGAHDIDEVQSIQITQGLPFESVVAQAEQPAFLLASTVAGFIMSAPTTKKVVNNNILSLIMSAFRIGYLLI